MTKNISIIQSELLRWFQLNRRELPWRETSDPYCIWVSEVMLQQTRVNSVIPYYNAFIRKFPTVTHLAQAEEDQVLKAWEGLGYYSRARNLHNAAKKVVRLYNGVVPNTQEEILTLDGIGPYTAGAILSIAYNKPIPAVDGNVMRVIARLFSIYEDITKGKTKSKIEQLVQTLIPQSARDFNEALMELGAKICLPTSPLCEGCPLMNVCSAYESDTVTLLPLKKRAAPLKVQRVVFLFITDGEDIVVEKRPDEGLLASLWGFPTLMKGDGIPALDHLYLWAQEVSVDIAYGKAIGKVRHIFTHRVWEGEVIVASLTSRDPLSSSYECISRREVGNRPFGVVYQKVMKMASQHLENKERV